MTQRQILDGSPRPRHSAATVAFPREHPRRRVPAEASSLVAAEAVLPLGVAGQERDWWSLLPCEVAGRREATSVMTEPPSDHVVRTDAGRPAGGSRAGRTAARTCGSFSHTVVRSGTAFRTRLVNRARLGVGGEAREEASRRSTFYWRRTAAPRAPRGDQSRPHFQVQVQIFGSPHARSPPWATLP